MKRFLYISVILGLLALLVSNICYSFISSVSHDRVYSNSEFMEQYDVALILGTSKFTRSGYINPYFKYRIEAAAELYLSGKVKKILVSGDNGHKSYNEPRDMMQSLIAKGVPAKDIILDYAGFRTFDSVVRAKEVFGQGRMVIVSQQFHLERALYIASSKQIDAVGYVAKDPESSRNILFTRELMARTKAVLDCYVLGTSPKFLGDKIDINI